MTVICAESAGASSPAMAKAPIEKTSEEIPAIEWLAVRAFLMFGIMRAAILVICE